MISVLIPTYNYNVFPLVSILFEQLEKSTVSFEIICLDDGSEKFHSENQQTNFLNNCSYSILEKNIGRSAIRNLLAKKAKYENLLFLDADVIPVSENFISTYLSHINSEEKAVYGGIRYQEEKPEKNQVLRWVYGNSREALSVEKRNENNYLSFLTLNFLISKSVFEKVKFNENIPNLRHEDTLFSFDLKQAQIEVIHIENPIIHNGLESSLVFLKKSEESLQGLDYLIENKLLSSEYVRLSEKFKKFKKYNLEGLYLFFYKTFKKSFLKNLLGKNPSMFVFDLYRLGYFMALKTK
ncbi:glycosyltransferase family 2 protein [Flavobacterium macacae]|uniref:Glycosyltransferase family 2 protein n=1 Tax=Flavobacterium macacae TaxID=2488993 RepID=A0A3P3WAF5_9FLAO|nr:glycosyltransferase family A protein [Flavobacterium macacae]RRJ89623.1 glycosyltransferase family 2 protein [Flavobacterium macacae]